MLLHLSLSMNYLAHAYLSFGDPGMLAGNMISDFVKGKKQYDYPLQIQKGIKLHRAIDTFTDTHEATREMKEIFRPHYRLYAGAFTDIVCDYFLANDRNEFATAAVLASFSKRCYEQLDEQIDILPPPFQHFFVYMKQGNFLYNYQFEENIQRSFNSLIRKATYLKETDIAFSIFKNNIETIRPYYNEFFPLLKNFAKNTFLELMNTD